ncbi:hypothetical protein D9M68_662680 [compost metagenome]
MRARHHHLFTRLQALGDHDQVAIGPRHHHRARLHGLARGVEHPDRAAVRLARGSSHQRAGGQLDHRGPSALRRGQRHIGGRAQGHRRPVRQRQLDLVGARGRIGARRHLTHHAPERGSVAGRTRGRRPQAHLRSLAHAQLRQPVFRHGKHHIAGAIARQAHHRRARGHHLAHLGLHGQHHAGRVGQQAGVSGLVALHRALRLGLAQAGFGGLQRGLAALDFSPADKALGLQIGETLQVGRGQIALRLRRAHLRLCGLAGQGQVVRIQLRQQLPRLHALAHLGRALQQLAPDPEAEPRLDPGPHLTGVLALSAHARGHHGDQLDRADRLLGRFRPRAGGQGQRGGHGKDKMRCFHDVAKFR